MNLELGKKRTYNPNKVFEDLTQRRKGTEKARKENTYKGENSHPLRLLWIA